MNLSRVVIGFITALFFATSVSGQQGRVATKTTPSVPSEQVNTMPTTKAIPEVAASGFTVMVFNFKQVSADILSNAEKEAGQIFAHVGMKIVWQECPTGNEPCHKGRGPVFFLAIKAGPAQNPFLDVVSGEAKVADHLAVIYYDALPRGSYRKPTAHEASTLLGCVIAHE